MTAPELTETATSRSTVAELAVKVPEVTAYFWAIKILSTAMGEALSDALDGGSGIVLPVLGCLAALVAFVIALRMQLRAPRYQTGTYWFAVAMVATFGTMAADGFHQALGIPYWGTTIIYLVALTVIFWRWYKSEGTLSIHSINTKRRERYYWATVLATFALGTAAGDMTATNFKWGFLTSGLVFTGIFLIPGIAYWLFRLNAIFAFWFAYIITRPLGASFADWLDVTKHRGGVGLGTDPVSLVLIALITLAVWLLGRSGKDQQRAEVAAIHDADPHHGHHHALQALVAEPEV